MKWRPTKTGPSAGGENMKKTFACLLILLSPIWLICSAAAAKEYTLERFEGLFEPSGVVQLAGGDIVIIEDEKNIPLWVFELKEREKKLTLAFKQRLEIKDYSYDDLEGIEVGGDGNILAITSHSLKKKKRKKSRERLLKFQITGATAAVESGENLYPGIMAALKELGAKPQTLNIEAVSFDRDKGHLLLGLRAPLDGDKAIVLEVKNLEEYFARGKAAEVKKRASLPVKAGIRAMSFDPRGNNFILVSEIEEKKGKQSALWLWDGTSQEVERLYIPGLKRVQNVEGVTLLRWNNKSYLLLVCDDGNRSKNQGAHYFIVEYKNK